MYQFFLGPTCCFNIWKSCWVWSSQSVVGEISVGDFRLRRRLAPLLQVLRGLRRPGGVKTGETWIDSETHTKRNRQWRMARHQKGEIAEPVLKYIHTRTSKVVPFVDKSTHFVTRSKECIAILVSLEYQNLYFKLKLCYFRLKIAVFPTYRGLWVRE